MTALREELERIKATLADKNDPSVVAVYEKGIEDLRTAGLERNALKAGELAPPRHL